VTKVYVTPGLLRDRRTLGLDRLSLEIRPNEFVGILGLNGSGKTTSMKLGLGLLRPTSGRVRLFGRDPAARDALNLVGYLPELPYFYSQLTPAEALRFYGRLSGMSSSRLAERIPRTLERVGLAKRANQRAGEFSKGMRQRLGLAQALLHDPRLLILDEPVSGLDPIAIKEMRDLLRSLRGEGKSIFLASHSISEVENLCDRVAILQRGRLVRVVEKSEWRSQPGALETILVDSVEPE
jgi:ABC-2 type transport system ATP-binding protein